MGDSRHDPDDPDLRAILLKDEGVRRFDENRDEIEILRPEDGYESPLIGPK